MQTEHRVVVGDSREMAALDDGEAQLVVTSPPYPMIEMWDETFASLDPAIGDRLDEGAGRAAFELMHDALADTWAEVARVLCDGGIAVVNVGDATRTVDGRFQRYPNHARVTEWFTDNGFHALPDVVWHKPANSAAKFMGSGMVPPNAYVTLEHEHLLVFRKGERRSFEPGADRRYGAAYFWEERNEWFSDVWTDVRGTFQALDHDGLRERSAAYPLAIPYRLINMYSVYGDTVLDPFWGTGTTSLAAAVAGRNSVGYELEPEFASVFEERLADAPELSRRIVRDRIDRHRAFVRERRAGGDDLGYDAAHYDFPVTTQQEREITLYTVADVEGGDGRYTVTHREYEEGREADAGSTIPDAADASESPDADD